jgi:hypothetical protein
MRISWKRKSTLQRLWDAVAGNMKGRALTVNGKKISPDKVAKPAVRAVGGLVAATVASAVVSSFRGRGGDE